MNDSLQDAWRVVWLSFGAHRSVDVIGGEPNESRDDPTANPIVLAASVERLREAGMRFGRRRYADKPEALIEDAVHEALVLSFRTAKARPKVPYLAWFYKVLDGRIVDAIRVEQRRARDACGRESIEDAFEVSLRSELLKCVRRILATKERRSRALFLAKVLLAPSDFKQLADRLGTNYEAARKLVQRIAAEIRSECDPEHAGYRKGEASDKATRSGSAGGER